MSLAIEQGSRAAGQGSAHGDMGSRSGQPTLHGLGYLAALAGHIGAVGLIHQGLSLPLDQDQCGASGFLLIHLLSLAAHGLESRLDGAGVSVAEGVRLRGSVGCLIGVLQEEFVKPYGQFHVLSRSLEPDLARGRTDSSSGVKLDAPGDDPDPRREVQITPPIDVRKAERM